MPIWFGSKKIEIFLIPWKITKDSYSAIILCTRILWVIFIHYHRLLLEEDMNRRRRSPGICFEGNPRRWSLAKIAVGKPGTFIYMDCNLASEDRPTMIAVRKPQLYPAASASAVHSEIPVTPVHNCSDLSISIIVIHDTGVESRVLFCE